MEHRTDLVGFMLIGHDKCRIPKAHRFEHSQEKGVKNA